MSDPLLVSAAFLLDLLLGDPPNPLHPIRLIARWSLGWERVLFACGLGGYLGGFLHMVLVLAGTLAAWWFPHAWLADMPWGQWLWDLWWAVSLCCLRDLLDHGRAVAKPLAAGNLPAARAAIARLVGRDTDTMDAPAVRRATLESLSENLTDGVLTPFWALCLFGVPGLIVVKVLSTLDSLVGYKTERYLRFGFWGARGDDLIHWIPARLSPLVVAAAATLCGGHPGSAVTAAWRWHGLLPSPNSGWAEAALAGALHCRLIGPIRKGGVLVTEVWMGDPAWTADPGDDGLRRGLRIVLVAGLIAGLVGVGVAVL